MSEIELVAERPVAGGRMLARHEGAIVLVSGTVPGERIRARIERKGKGVTWASTVEVLEAGPARRDPALQADCGGLIFAHVQYEHQLSFKAEIIADAFRRIAKHPLDRTVSVTGSPETGYRLRARLHLKGGRAVFFRDGSHTPCDPASTGQLRSDALSAVGAAVDCLDPQQLGRCAGVIVTENVVGNGRLIHFEPAEHASIVASAEAFASVEASGITTSYKGGLVTIAGLDRVLDTADELFGELRPEAVPPATRWRRGPLSFFQGNRYLIGSLAAEVLASVRGDRIADCYAGVGLFGVPLARGGRTVIAVEGDPHSADDLAVNARECDGRLTVQRDTVEHILPSLGRASIDTVIVDPPRTGLSDAARRAVGGGLAPRLIYVSCDTATLARDVRSLVESGYRLTGLRAFDLFPNTPHVETVAVFDR
jgi:23S rRNA (uracil1939-C5)-methyltransferase